MNNTPTPKRSHWWDSSSSSSSSSMSSSSSSLPNKTVNKSIDFLTRMSRSKYPSINALIHWNSRLNRENNNLSGKVQSLANLTIWSSKLASIPLPTKEVVDNIPVENIVLQSDPFDGIVSTSSSSSSSSSSSVESSSPIVSKIETNVQNETNEKENTPLIERLRLLLDELDIIKSKVENTTKVETNESTDNAINAERNEFDESISVSSDETISTTASQTADNEGLSDSITFTQSPNVTSGTPLSLEDKLRHILDGRKLNSDTESQGSPKPVINQEQSQPTVVQKDAQDEVQQEKPTPVLISFEEIGSIIESIKSRDMTVDIEWSFSGLHTNTYKLSTLCRIEPQLSFPPLQSFVTTSIAGMTNGITMPDKACLYALFPQKMDLLDTICSEIVLEWLLWNGIAFYVEEYLDSIVDKVHASALDEALLSEALTKASVDHVKIVSLVFDSLDLTFDNVLTACIQDCNDKVLDECCTYLLDQSISDVLDSVLDGIYDYGDRPEDKLRSLYCINKTTDSPQLWSSMIDDTVTQTMDELISFIFDEIFDKVLFDENCLSSSGSIRHIAISRKYNVSNQTLTTIQLIAFTTFNFPQLYRNNWMVQDLNMFIAWCNRFIQALDRDEPSPFMNTSIWRYVDANQFKQAPFEWEKIQSLDINELDRFLNFLVTAKHYSIDYEIFPDLHSLPIQTIDDDVEDIVNPTEQLLNKLNWLLDMSSFTMSYEYSKLIPDCISDCVHHWRNCQYGEPFTRKQILVFDTIRSWSMVLSKCMKLLFAIALVVFRYPLSLSAVVDNPVESMSLFMQWIVTQRNTVTTLTTSKLQEGSIEEWECLLDLLFECKRNSIEYIDPTSWPINDRNAELEKSLIPWIASWTKVESIWSRLTRNLNTKVRIVLPYNMLVFV